MEGNAQSASGGLIYEDTLCLRWRPAAGAGAAARIQEANEDFLRAMAALDAHVGPEDEHSATAQAIARLDLKIRLLTQMVGRMLVRQLDLPPPVPVRLSAQWIEWSGADPPAAGVQVEIEVYLLMDYPFPVVLAGAASADASHEGWTRVVLERVASPVQEWLERTIFRHHRRSVAQARRSIPRDISY